ncbi:MAG TPA: hypothetical protein VFA50_03435 [Stellaceae bacterium]|nr:hypothetical protein [Stellaceae bacterium]
MMRRSVGVIVLAIGIVAAAPAFANCKSAIQQVRPTISMNNRPAVAELDAAGEAQHRGNESACIAHAQRAAELQAEFRRSQNSGSSTTNTVERLLNAVRQPH